MALFSWYRSQIQQFGWLDATQLFLRVRASRARVGMANRWLKPTLACPCCGWRGRKFYDYIEPGYAIRNAACPQCDSHSRHRALHLWLRDEYRLAEKSGIALVFAPERALADVWRSAPGLTPIFVDIEPARGVDVLADLHDLPLRSESVDLIWCHHVLEHIRDDQRALTELFRTLKSDGEMVVSVPMEGGTTREFGRAEPRISYHWRMYGDDVASRFRQAGFEVRAASLGLDSKVMKQYGIVAEPFFICSRATRKEWTALEELAARA